MKKWIASALAVLLTCSCVACADDSVSGNDSVVTPSTSDSSSVPAPVEKSDALVYNGKRQL